jgi:hypothetical protein
MNVEQAKALFTEALRGLLSFEQHGDFIVIKPIQFLGSENFADIARVIQGNGGEYISAGKASYFRLPVGQTSPGTGEAPVAKAPPKAPENLHFKVTKLSVSLGTTLQQNETHWAKQSYGLEVEVNSDSKDVVEKAKAETEQLVRSWLSAEVSSAPPESKAPKPRREDIPHIDIGELNECEWQTYKKEPAKLGQAAWIKNPVEFTSWKDAPNVLMQLSKAISRSPDGKLVLGDMEYAFSGKGEMEKHFISRTPVKTESAR